jgi:hypothetical protein
MIVRFFIADFPDFSSRSRRGLCIRQGLPPHTFKHRTTARSETFSADEISRIQITSAPLPPHARHCARGASFKTTA